MYSVAKEVKKALNENTSPNDVFVPDYSIILKDTRNRDQFAPGYLPTKELLEFVFKLADKSFDTSDEDLKKLHINRDAYVYAISAIKEIILYLYTYYTEKINKDDIKYIH